MNHPFAKELSLQNPSTCRFSICTLVTDWAEYCSMAESFVSAGFAPAFCEYLYINNSAGTKADGYQGCNAFLSAALGHYIILCHQDIRLREDGIEQLEDCIYQMDQVDPSWALLGNIGGTKPSETVVRITDPSGNQDSGNLPARVHSLDENFILARRSANLCVSHDLSGFHLYGTDLCQVAHALGRTAWVINFNLLHKSSGSRDAEFFRLRKEVLIKYERIYRGDCLQTPSTVLPFSASAWANHQALFRALYELRKKCRRKGSSDEVERRLTEAYAIHKGSYALHWLYYKLTNPFQNLKRSVAKRLRKPTKSPGQETQ